MTDAVLLASALARLYARVPLGMRLGLDRMHAACARFGHPEHAFRAVHVAGTNGKGSVCAMVEAMARADGIRTGLYTSPHLCRFAERICLDGEPIEDQHLARTLVAALDDPAELSFFEAATMAAFLAFRDGGIDVGVIEVGLGGRLDATNVLASPRAAAITSIALDHTDRLGSTLVEIAREKAGIAKPGLDILLGPMPADVRAAIDEVAVARGATTSSVCDWIPSFAPGQIALLGDHQRENARVAAALATRIGVSTRSVAEGLAAVRWPGRLERIGIYLLDAAHNPAGAVALAQYVRSLGVPPERTGLIFAALSDKDWKSMLDALTPLAASRVYVAIEAAAGRAGVDPREIAARVPGVVGGDVSQALAGASGDLIVVAGSIGLVGRARAALLALPSDPPVPL